MRLYSLTLLLALGTCLVPAAAQDLVYRPVNPSFGGNPLNYSGLINLAQSQNLFQEETDPFQRDPLSDFEQSLQRQILSELSRAIVSDRFGGVDFTQEGRFDLGEFTIEITPGLNGLDIRIFNVLTGDESIITIPNP